MTTIPVINIDAGQMEEHFKSVLLKNGFSAKAASHCAGIFTSNSVDGVYTHGVNRFKRFVEDVKQGYVKKDAVPTQRSKFNGIEQWDGNLGPGVLNADFATQQSMSLASQYGIGCVALSNTNHWMRGGAYGWQAAKKGYVFIGWTNTIANMPAWGATDAKLGNNPLVIAVPYNDEAIVLDMAMSQYSFGAMELSAMKNEPLSVNGGFDRHGKLTNSPSEIIATRRPLPVGYWKGAGLSLLLDILAAVLSGGLSTREISQRKTEYGLSQVFICISTADLPNHSAIPAIINDIIRDYKNSELQDPDGNITYPGERVVATRKKNRENGIPVMTSVWEQILIL